MSNLKWVAGINLIILVVYTIIVNTNSQGSERSLAVLIIMAMCIAVQVGLNLIVAFFYFVTGNRPFAKSFLLSAVIVLLVGFSVCYGSASV